jgi:hypothetical protein
MYLNLTSNSINNNKILAVIYVFQALNCEQKENIYRFLREKQNNNK